MRSKFISVPLFFIAFLCFAFSTLAYLSDLTRTNHNLIEHTIENSKDMQITFDVAIEFINTSKHETGSYPTHDEFSDWAKSLPKMHYSPQSFMRYYLDNFPEDIIDEFGNPKRDSYALAVWRGDWYEYYASWKNKNTLLFEIDDYLFSIQHLLFGLLFTIGLFFLGKIFHPAPNK